MIYRKIKRDEVCEVFLDKGKKLFIMFFLINLKVKVLECLCLFFRILYNRNVFLNVLFWL